MINTIYTGRMSDNHCRIENNHNHTTKSQSSLPFFSGLLGAFLILVPVLVEFVHRGRVPRLPWVGCPLLLLLLPRKMKRRNKRLNNVTNKGE